MSWIFGYIGKNLSDVEGDLNKTHSNPLAIFKDKNFYIAAGGNKRTIFYRKNSYSEQQNISGWVVSGLGIIEKDAGYKLLKSSDWSNIFSKGINSLNFLDGHFAGIKWNEKGLTFFSDALGLRDINIIKANNGFYFSTRIDWLSKISSGKLDLNVFGSRWLLVNQISHESLIENSVRIVSGSIAKIENNKLTVTKNIWDFKRKDSSDLSDFYKKIESITLAGTNSNRNISLSLSGGLDSRFLFAILIKNKSTNFEAHTFGNPEHPDSVIAKKLCTYFDIKHNQFDIITKDSINLIDLIQDYITFTNFTNPISSALHLGNYKNTDLQNKVLIDGGFGEIWRRGFLNKFLFYGEKYLLEKDFDKIISLLTINRSNIFAKEFTDILNFHMQEQILSVINKMPEISDIGFENWLDLFAIRTRLVNFYGPEQAYADSVVETYMPFAQQSLINQLPSIPIKLRKNNKFVMNFIKSNNYKLTSYPLVKGSVKIHFSSNTIEARLLSKIKTKLGLAYRDQDKVNLIIHLREFVLDRINSLEFRQNDIYNQRAIKTIINDFFNGKEENVNFIDNWLAFDIFLNKFNNKSLY